MSVKSVYIALLDAYQRYGQKLYIVLSTALKIAKMNRVKGVEHPGDFEYRALVEELEVQGFRYNPSMLLRILEREYNIIETTYRSGNQHWYKFKDLEEVERALNVIVGIGANIEDPDVALLKIQLKSLQIGYWVKKLKHLCVKQSLSNADTKLFRDFAFNVLPKLVKILKKAEEYDDILYAEISLLRELLNLASIVADRIDISREPVLYQDGTTTKKYELDQALHL